MSEKNYLTNGDDKKTVKALDEEMKKMIGFPMESVVAILGSPRIKYTDNMWLVSYKNCNIMLTFSCDGLSFYHVLSAGNDEAKQ
jgi:hypothetical protein